jgi:hypothetical protein
LNSAPPQNHIHFNLRSDRRSREIPTNQQIRKTADCNAFVGPHRTAQSRPAQVRPEPPSESTLPSAFVGDFADPAFVARISTEFGLNFTECLEELVAFTAILQDQAKQPFVNHLQVFRPMLLSLQARSVTENHSESLLNAVDALEIKRRLSAKISRRFTRLLTADGVPWSDHLTI